MGIRRSGQRRVIVGVPLAAFLVAGVSAAPAQAQAESPTPVTAPETRIIAMSPAPQTKIIQLDPAPAPAPAPALPAAPAPVPRIAASPAVPSGAAPAGPSAVSAAVPADSPALRALVEASAAEKRRLGAEVTRLEADVAVLRAAFDTATQDLATRQGDEQVAQARVGTTEADLAVATARVAADELAAASATAAVAGTRTPVARPASKGHTPEDAAARARGDLATSTGGRDELVRVLAARNQDLQAASTATAAAAAVLTGRTADLQHGLDALDQARQQRDAAEQAPAPRLSPPSTGTLRPAPSNLAAATIPVDYRLLYGRAASSCPGLSWAVLAAVGSVESGHGQSTAPGVRSGANFAGAMGPMQFLAGTWAAYGVDGDGDGVRDVYNPADAVFGAANYLCASGAGNVSTLRQALFAYNHADWYVEAVLALAARL